LVNNEWSQEGFTRGPRQWRAEGGANGAPAPGIQGKGASKE